MALVIGILLIGFGIVIGMVMAAVLSKSPGRCEGCFRTLDDETKR